MRMRAVWIGFAALLAVTLSGCASGVSDSGSPTVAIYATPSDAHRVGVVDPSAVSYECWAPSGQGDFALVVRDDRSVGYVRVPVEAPDLGMTVTAADMRQCSSPSEP